MSYEYKTIHLYKVRERPDRTLNGDDIAMARSAVVKDQCLLLDCTLMDFADTINLLDARFFDKIKHDIWGLQRSIGTRKLETEGQEFANSLRETLGKS